MALAGKRKPRRTWRSLFQWTLFDNPANSQVPLNTVDSHPKHNPSNYTATVKPNHLSRRPHPPSPNRNSPNHHSHLPHQSFPPMRTLAVAAFITIVLLIVSIASLQFPFTSFTHSGRPPFLSQPDDRNSHLPESNADATLYRRPPVIAQPPTPGDAPNFHPSFPSSENQAHSTVDRSSTQQWEWPKQPAGENLQCTLVSSFVGVEDAAYPFNARSFCVARDLCLSSISPTGDLPTLYVDGDVDDAKCTVHKSDLITDSGSLGNYCVLLRNNVVCGNGDYYSAGLSTCPNIEPLAKAHSQALGGVQTLDADVVVVVPAHMYLGNVYHFSFVASNTIYITAGIPNILRLYYGNDVALPPSLRVKLLFRGQLPREIGLWQRGILDAMIKNRLQKLNMSISFDTFNERIAPDGRTLCMRNAILIGKRRALALWPYPNVTDTTSPDGLAVHVESIASRRAAYDYADIPTALPDLPGGTRSSPPASAFSDLPGKVIGYARRNSLPDPPPGAKIMDGTTRRFSDADEEWFVSMLKQQAADRGYEYRTLQPSENMTFEEQVRMFADVGIVVGIHGANFVNAIFSRPFSAILEILAVDSPCYIAGANSGLRYWRYEPKRRATVEESHCRTRSCKSNPKMHRVVIDDPDDRRAIPKLVGEMIDYIDGLYKQHAPSFEASLTAPSSFSGKDFVPQSLPRIPITYDADTFSYRRAPLP